MYKNRRCRHHSLPPLSSPPTLPYSDSSHTLSFWTQQDIYSLCAKVDLSQCHTHTHTFYVCMGNIRAISFVPRGERLASGDFRGTVLTVLTFWSVLVQHTPAAPFVVGKVLGCTSFMICLVISIQTGSLGSNALDCILSKGRLRELQMFHKNSFFQHAPSLYLLSLKGYPPLPLFPFKGPFHD